MNTSSFSLEIKVISGEGLRFNKRQPAKKDVFVIVHTDSINAQTTNIDSGEKLMVEMPTNSRFITIEVRKGRSNNKLIGAARIPVTDFFGGYTPMNYLHLLSYRLRDGKGQRNGIINFSLRVKVAPENGGYGWRPSTGTVVAEEVAGGVVTGVPVWYGYRV